MILQTLPGRPLFTRLPLFATTLPFQKRLPSLGRRRSEGAIIWRRTLGCSACRYISSVLEPQDDPAISREKKKLVFLGTPEVAAGVLKSLLHAAAAENSIFEVAAVVTQPPSSRGRGRKAKELTPSPVALLALEENYPQSHILSPKSAREEGFLSHLASLRPDLCVTAAYGNILPEKFLEIPGQGTVNIHPSLLPLYRGAAPVQRAIEDGVKETGVSVAFTVRAMDAGPIIAVEKVEVPSDVKATQLLEELFHLGTKLLMRELPSILDGSAALRARPQDALSATNAAKVSAEEGVLNFSLPAVVLHNKVRAFAAWPGTKATLLVENASTGELEEMVVKVITTRTPGGGPGLSSAASENASELVSFKEDCLCVPCDDGSVLQIMELQPISKKVMAAKDFWNGLRGRQLYRP